MNVFGIAESEAGRIGIFADALRDARPFEHARQVGDAIDLNPLVGQIDRGIGLVARHQRD
jgi:hypothetical protein